MRFYTVLGNVIDLAFLTAVGPIIDPEPSVGRTSGRDGFINLHMMGNVVTGHFSIMDKFTKKDRAALIDAWMAYRAKGVS